MYVWHYIPFLSIKPLSPPSYGFVVGEVAVDVIVDNPKVFHGVPHILLSLENHIMPRGIRI